MTTSHLAHCPPVRDQRTTFSRSCGGYAGANALSIMLSMDRKEKVQFCTEWIWNAAKFHARITGDSDTYGDGVAWALATVGGLPQSHASSYWTSCADCEGNSFESAMASDYRADKAFSMSPKHAATGMVSGPEMLEQIRGWVKVRPVICSVKVDQEFMLLGDKVWHPPYPHEQVLYGHMVCLVGVNDEEETLTCMNSWGIEWGEKGFGRIHFDAVRQLALSDA